MPGYVMLYLIRSGEVRLCQFTSG